MSRMQKLNNPVFIIIIALPFFLPCRVKAQSEVTTHDEHWVEIGKVIPISSSLGIPIVEPSLAIHPSNPNHILVAAMAITDSNNPYQSARLLTFLSQNGGQNWTETVWDYWGYDPWISMMPNGHTTLAWLGTRGSFKHVFPLQLFRSADGGITWSTNVQQINNAHGHDGTKVIYHNDSFIASTARFNADMSADIAVYKAEADEPFEELTQVSGKGIRLNFCEPAILSNGTMILPGSEFQRRFWIQKWEKDDTSLSKRIMISMRAGGGRGYMRLVHDNHTSSPWQDRLYFVRALASGGVWINYSSDNGETWSRDMRIDTFTTGLASKANLASASVTANGVLGISWIDSQNDPEQKGNDLYFSYSVDGGLTFNHPTKITEVSSDPVTPKNADVANKFSGGGHYMDIKSAGENTFVAVWSDSSTGIFELKTCHIKLHRRS